MDLSSATWFSGELGLVDCNFNNHCQMRPKFSSSYECTAQLFGESYYEISQARPEKPTNDTIRTTNGWSSITRKHDLTPQAGYSSSSRYISFNDSGSPPPTRAQPFHGNIEYCNLKKPKYEVVASRGGTSFSSTTLDFQGSKSYKIDMHEANHGTQTANYMMSTTSSHARDHVMAERMRREKLAEQFVALSAIVPGLKKLDKASVLGGAAKYLKELQERVRSLEKQNKRKYEGSVVVVKKSELSADDESSLSDQDKCDSSKDPNFPEIEARFLENNVLIRIHCDKSKGCVIKILGEIEKLHLNVVNTIALPFGNHAMDITIVAQMDTEFRMLAKDLVRNLRSSL